MGFVVMRTKRSILVMFLILSTMDPMSLITKRKQITVFLIFVQTSPTMVGFLYDKNDTDKNVTFAFHPIIRQSLHTQMI